jgi:MoaA/NifB/PqqE/SkfB family radical SAM enzyme
MNKSSYIPEEKMFEIIEDITEMGVKAVTFSGGGDPLCYPYLLDTIKVLSETPIKFATLTNGQELTGELAEIFANKASWIRISVDGWDDKSYSDYRKIKEGIYSKIIKNMENFKKIKGNCKLGVAIVVDKKNAYHVYDMIKKFSEIGVDSVKVYPCVVSDSIKENNNYHESVFDIVKENINKAIIDLKSKDFEIFDCYYKLDEKYQKDYTWCPYLQIVPVIGADLNVYSCHDKAYNIKEGATGSISKQRFKELWFSDKSIFFKINPVINCNHHCAVNPQNRLLIEYLNLHKEHIDFV